MSDVANVEQRVPAQTVGASYGDAYLAGYGIGLYDDYRAIDKWLRTVDNIVPRPAVHAQYDKYYGLYRALYEACKRQLHELALLGAAD